MAKDEADTSTQEPPEITTETAIQVVTRQITELAIVEGYRITSMPEAQGANEALGKVKALAKMIDAAKMAERAPLNEKLKAISAAYIPAETLLEQAETTLKGALIAFKNAEEKRLAEERRLAAEAAIAERARLEDAARKEREAAEKKAAALQAQGKDEKAQAVLQAAASSAAAKEAVASMVAAPAKPVAAPKFAGASFRKVWKAKVVNWPVFLKALADSPVYSIEEFVQANEGALNKLAASMKDRMDKAMPGTISWEEDSMGARSK